MGRDVDKGVEMRVGGASEDARQKGVLNSLSTVRSRPRTPLRASPLVG